MNPSLSFFLPEREYIELELTLVEPQGVDPLVLILLPVFLYISEIIPVEFQVIPRTFKSAQK